MTCMFSDCSSLQELDLSSFDTHNVTYMDYMFYNCSSLQHLNLSRFNMDAVTDKSYMFTSFASQSGHCTITSPASVRTAISTGTQLNTSKITWN